MEQEFENESFSDFLFFEAIDGNDLQATKELYDLFLGNNFNWRKGIIGCALSHYNVWKMLYLEKEPYIYGIFEDDFKLEENFAINYDKCLEYMRSNPKIDMLLMGYHSNNSNSMFSREEFSPFNAENYIGGFFGYMMSRSGAQKLLRYIKRNGIIGGIDYIPMLLQNFNIYQCNTFIVTSNWVSQIHSNVDSDIQKSFNALKFDYEKIYSIITINGKKYKYYQGLDIPGNDLKFINKQPLHMLARQAELEPNCIGFNNLGYLKSNLGEILPGPWENLKNNGLYIKET